MLIFFIYLLRCVSVSQLQSTSVNTRVQYETCPLSKVPNCIISYFNFTSSYGSLETGRKLEGTEASRLGFLSRGCTIAVEGCRHKTWSKTAAYNSLALCFRFLLKSEGGTTSEGQPEGFIRPITRGWETQAQNELKTVEPVTEMEGSSLRKHQDKQIWGLIKNWINGTRKNTRFVDIIWNDTRNRSDLK